MEAVYTRGGVRMIPRKIARSRIEFGRGAISRDKIPIERFWVFYTVPAMVVGLYWLLRSASSDALDRSQILSYELHCGEALCGILGTLWNE